MRWELVEGDIMRDPILRVEHETEVIERARVPGGWLVRCLDPRAEVLVVTAITYVPDTAGEWELGDEG